MVKTFSDFIIQRLSLRGRENGKNEGGNSSSRRERWGAIHQVQRQEVTGSGSPSTAEADWHVRGTVTAPPCPHWTPCFSHTELLCALNLHALSQLCFLPHAVMPFLSSPTSTVLATCPSLLKSCLLQEAFPECLSWHTSLHFTQCSQA